MPPQERSLGRVARSATSRARRPDTRPRCRAVRPSRPPIRGPGRPPSLYSAPMTNHSDGVIDLRSDTVTKPTDEMRRAMAAAEVGDDVFDDDPTVHALQERAAELLGKEAGLFVASGAMGNIVAQLAHLARGQETIAGAESHIVQD